MNNLERNPEYSNFKPKTPEKKLLPREKLEKLLTSISETINKKMLEAYGLKNLVDSECKLSMDGFSQEQGGIYSQSEIDESRSSNLFKEMDFTSAGNPDVQAFYKNQYQADTSEKIIKVWKENKKKAKSGQIELAVTILLNKILGDRYLVVRTTDFDDYNGVDNVILDRETGAVVCGFDEVHTGMDGNLRNKEAKVSKIISRGGAKLKFGVALKNDKVVRAGLTNLPIFYLGLSADQLKKLTDGIINGSATELSEIEVEIFNNLATSIKIQTENNRDEAEGKITQFTNASRALGNIALMLKSGIISTK